MNDVRRPFARLATAAWLLVLLCAGCASAPGSYVVLLRDPDGSTGKVMVTDARGARLLERAGQATALDGRSTQPFDLASDQVARDFGVAIAARPPLAEALVIRFERGGARLPPESLPALQAFVERLKQWPVPEVVVVGHTDTVGDVAFNERLGLARARAVAAALVAQGVEAFSLQVETRGERSPAVATGDEVDEPANRRAVVTVR